MVPVTLKSGLIKNSLITAQKVTFKNIVFQQETLSTKVNGI